MQQLTSEEIKKKINEGENFVLDLFAVWCGPCKIMLNNLERVNASYSVYKFDVESDMDFSKELGIRSVPTIKIFKEGTEVFSKSGVMSTSEVLGLLKS
jgi:thioredoxin 1